MDSTFYLPQTVTIPMPLYKSMKGRYFVGCADDLDFTGAGISAWGALVNPPDSDVNLHVNVWTVTSLFGAFRAQVWMGSSMPGTPKTSEFVTTSNFTIHPQPQPKVQLQYASSVTGEPEGGVIAFVRRGQAESTIAAEEEGKFIFPPGGSFSVLLSNPETPGEKAAGCVAFGWWEEPIAKSSYLGRDQRFYGGHRSEPSTRGKLPPSSG